MQRYSEIDDEYIIALKLDDGKSYREIGEVLGRTPSSVRSRWRKLQKQRGLTHRWSRRVQVSVLTRVRSLLRRLLH